MARKPEWSTERVLNELKEVNVQLGHSPSTSEISGILYQACWRLYGSFNNAKRAAGLNCNAPKYNLPSNNYKKLSEDFAYIYGVYLGDGYALTKTSTGIIGLRVKDVDFARKFKAKIVSWSGIPAKLTKNKRDLYEVLLYSINCARYVEDYEIKDILKSPVKTKQAFLQGLFDSEGCIVHSNLNKRRFASRWVSFSNNNTNIIDAVSTLLNEFGIKHTIKSRVHSGFGSKKLQYELMIYGFKNLLWFYNNISFSIARKQVYLKQVLDSYVKYSLDNKDGKSDCIYNRDLLLVHGSKEMVARA